MKFLKSKIVLLVLLLAVSSYLHASTKELVTICKSNDHCISSTNIQQFVIAQAGGQEANVVLVNDTKGETSLYEVRIHDFGGSEFPGMMAVTASEVAKANGIAHTNSMALATFLNDPITETLSQSSILLDNIDGFPAYPLIHFYDEPHALNINGGSMRVLNAALRGAINDAYQNREQALLDDVDSSVTGSISVTFKKVVTAQLGATLGNSPALTEGQVLFKANTAEGDAAWGVTVLVSKNFGGGLLTKITSIVLIQDSKIIFEISLADDGTVDLASLLGTTFNVGSNSNMGSLRAWFSGIGLNINWNACANNRCKVTVTDIKPK
jgi:hypothetical protein